MIGPRRSPSRRRTRPHRRLAALAAFLLAAVVLAVSAGCAQEAVPHIRLAGDLEPLRDAFNRDSGSVRAVLLASPT